MQKIFISYKHDDIDAVNALKSVNNNPNNGIEFIDWSLSEAISNPHGHVNRRPPFDPYANSVNNKIINLLKQADKMLVLIGQNTHSSLWVQWEVEKFRNLHGDRNILLMGIKGGIDFGVPKNARGLEYSDWNMNRLNEFIKK